MRVRRHQDSQLTSPAEDAPNVGRLISLSDNVVAFALTLLVLQLAVPQLHHASAHDPGALANALRGRLGQLGSYALSFFVIAQFWLYHRRAFAGVTGHREGLAWRNFAFLLCITLMPFTSELLGNYGGNPVAVDVFAGNMLLASLASHATVSYARKTNLVAAEDGQTTRLRNLRWRIVTGIIVASIALAWLNTIAASCSWLLIATAPRLARYWTASRRRDYPADGALPD